jgi:hypothetical protein
LTAGGRLTCDDETVGGGGRVGGRGKDGEHEGWKDKLSMAEEEADAGCKPWCAFESSTSLHERIQKKKI